MIPETPFDPAINALGTLSQPDLKEAIGELNYLEKRAQQGPEALEDGLKFLGLHDAGERGRVRELFRDLQGADLAIRLIHKRGGVDKPEPPRKGPPTRHEIIEAEFESRPAFWTGGGSTRID
jgi:hypothetical protein